MSENQNIYDTANQLASELRDTEQFKELEKAFEAVHADEEASKLFQEFKDAQSQVQQKQMLGQEVSEEDMENIQAVAERIAGNEYISNLMKYERHLNDLINDLNRVITAPIAKLYQQ